MIMIYWSVLALVFLGYGIQRDYLKMRTVGLYIILTTKYGSDLKDEFEIRNILDH